MNIILFILILAALVLVHELGHFLSARWSGISVKEFGIGLPPKIARLFKWKETDFTINAIPFGGFVKIIGENPNEEALSGPDAERSFMNKPKLIQALVLVAGVAMNIIFAWFLISLGFMSGMPTPASYSNAGNVRDIKVVITSVMPDSPAEKANLKSGDVIRAVSFSADEKVLELTPANISEFISSHNEVEIIFSRNKVENKAAVAPIGGIVEGRKAIGVSMDAIGILQLPIYSALWEGMKTTARLTSAVTIGLAAFLADVATGRGDFSEVTGPVGIVGLVGDVSELGFIYLLSFTAFISINLAVINLIPFPALDGGRLLFVAIEAISRKRVNPKVANTLNAIGFALLILLMVVVTFHDIAKLL